MEPRQNQSQTPKVATARKEKPKLQIVKLEDRIAPLIITYNHNETLVREPAKAKPKAPQPRKGRAKGRFRVVKLEERIAPVGQVPMNHNETLVRDRSA